MFVPNCPDEAVFLPAGFRFPRADKRADGLPFRLVTHGSLLERYGIHVLLGAMAQLKTSIPDLKLEVIGSGEYESELIAQAHRWAWTKPCIFRDRSVERMAERLLKADIGVGPSCSISYPTR